MTPMYTQDDLHTLQPQYTQRLEINNAMRHTRDDRLMVEVHRYHNLVNEQAQKQAEVDRLNDCIADILLKLRRCVLRLTWANAVTCIEEKRADTVHCISPWSFK